MKAKRLRFSIEDTNGGKYSISAEGNFQQSTLMDLIAKLDTISGDQSPSQPDISILQGDTLQSRIARLVEERFNLGSFSSGDLKEAFEDKYQQPISLSATATYLSRLTARGLLQRQRNGPAWLYRVTRQKPLIKASSDTNL